MIELGLAEKELARTSTLDVGSEDRRVLARERRAAALKGQYRCQGYETLPARVDLALIPVPDDGSEPQPRQWPASGPTDERHVEAGPFEAGPYLVALRPAGYQRWTWVGGGEERGRATPVTIPEASTADVATVWLDCGPLVVLDVVAANGAAVPDLADRAQVTLTAEQVLKDHVREVPLRVEVRGAHAFVRGLPEGEVRLRGGLRHPRLVGPGLELPGTWTVHLARGAEVRRQLVAAEILPPPPPPQGTTP